MKQPKIKTFILLFLVSLNLYSQKTELSYFSIPKELKDNANAVIRLNETEVTIEKSDKKIVNVKRIITVLNKAGDKHKHAYVSYNNDTKITSLSATFYNSKGSKTKKYINSDFHDVSATESGTIASDSRYKYLEHTTNSYPYTLVFEYQIKSNTTGYIRNWFPIEEYHVSIEKDKFTINNPNNLELRSKETNFDNYPIAITKDENIITYELTNQLAYRKEAYTPNMANVFPKVMFAINDFSLKGLNGIATNWKEFGKWQYDNLIQGKEDLPKDVKEKIALLVSKQSDTLEKAKIVYAYMQERTRYISVQLGIGGFSPEYASKVHELSYGDCKGLTNYTKELLSAAGITSYYTEVYAGNLIKDIVKDFHSIQGDHIILNIPYNGEDVWLECTSQTNPFGFLGTFTDDRNVLVMTPEGGVIKHTPSYKNDQNLQTTTSNVIIDNKGNVRSNVSIETKGTQYARHYHIENYDAKETIVYYKSNYWDEINNLTINKFDFNNDRDNIRFTETIDLDINNYATFTGDNLLLSVNIFNKYTNLPRRQKSRKLPIQIQRGFKDVDVNIITVPENYSITKLPSPKIIESEFGSYKVSFKQLDNNHFEYHRSLLIKAGIYPKESYTKYRSFMKSINKYDNKRVAFTKTTITQ